MTGGSRPSSSLSRTFARVVGGREVPSDGPTYAHPWDVDAMHTCGSGQAPALGSVCWKTRVFGLVFDDDPPL